MPGAQVGATARVFSMLTGLPLAWLDRQAEHVLGRSVEWIDVHSGRAERLQAERQVLVGALGGTTAPVVATSSVTLTHPDLRALIEEHCDIVHLKLDPEVALHRIREASAQDPRKHYAIRDGQPFEEANVRSRLLFFERLLRDFSDTIDIHDRLPLEVGQQLAERFEPLA